MIQSRVFLFAFVIISVVACGGDHNSPKEADSPLVIPDTLKLQQPSSPSKPASDIEYSQARKELLTIDSYFKSDFDADDYLFCPSRDQSKLTQEQKQLVADIQANCVIQQPPPTDIPEAKVGQTATESFAASIKPKTGAACPLLETRTGALREKILSWDTNSWSGSGPMDFSYKRIATTDSAQALLNFSEETVSESGTYKSQKKKGDAVFRSYGSYKSSEKWAGSQGVTLEITSTVQMLERGPWGQVSVVSQIAPFLRNHPALTISYVGHWDLSAGLTALDEMTLNGRKVEGADLMEFQSTRVISGLIKSMRVSQACPDSH